MRSVLALAPLLLVSSNAWASYYQITCSDAYAVSSFEWGHSTNEITLADGASHARGGTPVAFDFYELQWEITSETVLQEESNEPCVDGTHVAWSKKTAAREYTFTRRDGGRFADSLLGLSDDGLSVTATLICADYFDSRAFCPTPESTP